MYYLCIYVYSQNSVKRSDVTGNRFEWELGENKVIRPSTPYFIVLASSLTTMEVKAIEFHRIHHLDEHRGIYSTTLYVYLFVIQG